MKYGYRRVHYVRISKVTVLGVVVQIAPENVDWFAGNKDAMKVRLSRDSKSIAGSLLCERAGEVVPTRQAVSLQNIDCNRLYMG